MLIGHDTLWFKLTLRLVFPSVLFVIASLTACDQEAAVIENRTTSGSLIDRNVQTSLFEDAPIIVAFGNSLTAGLGVRSDQTYPAQLQKQLSEAALPFRVVNMGVNGETTAGALRRLAHIKQLRPAIVILEFGANDGLRGLDVSQTHSNLAQIIERLQEQDIVVVLTGMKLPPNYGPSYVRAFVDIFPTLAEQYDTPFMPFFLQDVATKLELNQSDGIHPTAKGYSIIIDNLWPVLLPVLEGF